MRPQPHEDWEAWFSAIQRRARVMVGLAGALMVAAPALLRSWVSGPPLAVVLPWLGEALAASALGGALGGALVSRLDTWRALQVSAWHCAVRASFTTACLFGLLRAVTWDTRCPDPAVLVTGTLYAVFWGALVLFVNEVGLGRLLALALRCLGRRSRGEAIQAIRQHEMRAAESFLREEGTWVPGPTEPIAADAPVGRGTEPEQAPAPAGRGTEVERASDPSDPSDLSCAPEARPTPQERNPA